jgi:SAM-dependent methyltransferase
VIHRTAKVGFSRSADAYERSRPGYPDEAVEHFVSRLPAGARVLDLAAGTGKLTRPLVASGLEVVAVEPVAEMRAALPSDVRALEGTAEAIPLPNGYVDAASVGQAFHWFDGERALPEIHRVLRGDGVLGLLWNRRREDDAVNREISAILAPHRRDTPAHSLDRWRASFEKTGLFGPFEERIFTNMQTLDADGMAGRIGSISFIAALDDDERARVLERARALAGDGTVAIPYRCEVQICRALS